MSSTATVAAAAAQPFDVLVFSKTAGYRHESIPAGIAAIRDLGAANDFTVTATEDAGAFTTDNLAQFEAVVFLSTTGDVLDPAQQAAFEGYIGSGGGYVGIHAASDTEYTWPWYGELVGAYFDNHPAIQEATIDVADRVHPSTSHLPAQWTRTDEWYSFGTNPRGKVHVLAALDETSYDAGNGMGSDHPIAWCQNVSGGRSWYTAGGHTVESFADEAFLTHLLGGLRTAAGVEDADCRATVDASFEQVTLAKGAEKTGEPMAMAVLPDGDVVHTSRDGRVWLTTADATTTLAGTVPVYSHDEDGLQGVAVDPGFATNRWVYLYYAPPLDTPAGDAPTTGDAAAFEPFEGHNQLSRFTLGTDGVLDLASEQQILQVPASRGICCHAGGEIDFDAAGNLYLSTGDDTNPFASDGYTPIDERSERNPAYDAQRSSGNTNDLRGKVLRITVADDGSYTIPDGNLFAPGTELARPEIYAMGFRNPFRFAVDKATGWIYLGDYGPDAGAANPARGPGGTVEFNLIKAAGNYGWPYCIGANQAFVDYDFATGQSGAAFDCANPTNTSPNNTGLTELPPAQPAWIPYDGGSVPDFGTGGESPMGGPVYNYDPDLASETKFPAYYDGKNLSYEWDRGWIKEFVTDTDGTLVDVVPTLDWLDLRRPMNLEFGPDGSLYILDYGGGYFGGDALSALYRVDYVGGNRSPIATIETSATNGAAPLTVDFDASASLDPDGGEISYAWDFTDDGTVDGTGVTASHTYDALGVHTARLTVTNGDGREGTATVTITVGNTAPTVVLETPADGGVFGFGDQVPFRVTVTDPEDGQIDCSRVVVEYVLGHDNHGHPLSREVGCEGTITTVADDGHGLDADVFGVVNATYTDAGGSGGVPALTGEDESVLHTRDKQAEFFTDSSGIQVVSHDGASGGRQVGYIANGDWIMFDPVNLTGVDGVSFRYASGGIGGSVEVRSGAPDGPLVAGVDLAPTGGWNVHAESDVAAVTDPGGSAPLYFLFTGAAGGDMFDIDVIRFQGRGVADNTAPRVTATATPTSGAAPLDVEFAAEATDADGDELTYAWTFGDGATGDGAAPSHTYTEPGDYTAEVTVSDPRGASASASVDIEVDLDIPCADPGAAVDPNDEFDGDAIDGCRWDVIDYDPSLARVAGGTLTLTTTDDDFYTTPNTGVPNILRSTQVTGDRWTVETSFTAALASDYQQAGIIVYGDADNYVKLDPVHSGTGATPLRVELRSEIDGVIQQPQGDITGLPLSTYGTYFLRLTRDGDVFSGEYSTDGETWTTIGNSVANTRLDGVGAGIYALGRYQEAPTTVAFDYVHVEEPPPPACAGSDEFDGSTIDDCTWRVVNPDPGLAEVSGGALRITTTDDDVYGGSNSVVPNILRSRVHTGERWSVETEITAEFAERYQQGGLIVYGDAGNYVKVGAIYTGNAAGPVGFEVRSEMGDVVQQPQPGSGALPVEADRTYHVRLTRDGDTFVGSWSLDGVTWTDFPAVTNTALAGVGPGPFALGKNQTAPTEVAFDHVRFAGDDAACTPGEVEEGYRALFDGTSASLANWRMAGPGHFQLAEDCSILSVGGMGLLWHPEELGAYSLKADWKMAGDDNSGVFVGFPDPGDDPWVAVNQGYEIQIDASDAPDRTTGAVYSFQGADAAARDAALNPPGEWNSYEIVVTGPRIRVYLNDVLVNDFVSTDPARDLEQGFVGLQNHGTSDDVWFRNVRVKDLDITPPDVVVDGVADGASYGDSLDLEPSWSAEDSDSGVAGVVATLDGAELAEGSRLVLHQLELGLHTLEVVATDAAGNTGTVTVRFTVTTSYRDLEALVARFAGDGVVDATTAGELRRAIDRAQKYEAKDKLDRAQAELERVRSLVADRVADETARRALDRDAQALIRSFGGTPAGEVQGVP